MTSSNVATTWSRM